MENHKPVTSDVRLHSIVAKQPAPFLSKTWALLEDRDNAHLVSWSPSGDSFIVHQPDAFARELLPTVFKHNNYTSFVRQLNIYGFRKLPAAHQEFCHPCFKLGQPQLLSQIQRGGMSSSSSLSADGPAAEISLLRSQVDKLSNAVTYTLAELHRRGYDTLRFDWKELVFVDPNVVMATAVAPKVDGSAHATQYKRTAANGSMLHLQHSVEEIRAVHDSEENELMQKSEHRDAPGLKYQRTEQSAGHQLPVPLPELHPSGIAAHSSMYAEAGPPHSHTFGDSSAADVSVPSIPGADGSEPQSHQLPEPFFSAPELATSRGEINVLIPGPDVAQLAHQGCDNVPGAPTQAPLYVSPNAVVVTTSIDPSTRGRQIPDMLSAAPVSVPCPAVPTAYVVPSPDAQGQILQA